MVLSCIFVLEKTPKDNNKTAIIIKSKIKPLSGSKAKVWTEVTIPDLTKNSPM